MFLQDTVFARRVDPVILVQLQLLLAGALAVAVIAGDGRGRIKSKNILLLEGDYFILETRKKKM